MSFSLRPFTPPDFTQEKFQNAPNAVLVPCPKDGVAPEHYHAMSIFPEYFKVEGQWIMAKESRMDCVPVYENGVIYVREFRILKAGDLVFTGRTENARMAFTSTPTASRRAPPSRTCSPSGRTGPGRRHSPRITMKFMISCATTGTMARSSGSWGLRLPLTTTPGTPLRSW